MTSLKNTKIMQGCFSFFILLVCLFGFSRVALATSVIAPSDESMIIGARAIVRAKVTAVSCGFDNLRNDVFTYVTLRVRDVIKGHITDERIVVKQFGGEASGNATFVYGSPKFSPGEELILYLDTWKDGSLRVYQMFLGKVALITNSRTGRTTVSRYIPEGQIKVPGQSFDSNSSDGMEVAEYIKMVRNIIAANSERVIETETQYHAGVAILSRPPEYIAKSLRGELKPQFTFALPVTRWFEFDAGQQVRIYTNTDGAPTPEGSSPSDIVNDMVAGMNTWSSIFGCNVQLANSGTISECTNSTIPIGYNTILFNNCDERFTASSCPPGLLALTYVKSTSEQVQVNGQRFFRTVEGHISFNPYASCLFNTHCLVQEVATHELGHFLGLGHSAIDDATMRGIHVDGRCASVRQDDIDGIRAIYPSPQYEGYFERADCSKISGWAWDSTHPESAITVSILDGYTRVGGVLANLPRQDLIDAGKGNGYHAFSLDTPWYFKDGRSRWIRLLFGNSYQALYWSPRSIVCGGTIFTSQLPASVLTDANTWEEATQFRSYVDGYITHIRFYKAPGEIGTHIGRIWSDTGTQLASVVFTNESPDGWQEQALQTPLAISAGVNYRVSYNMNRYLAKTYDGLNPPIYNDPLITGAGYYSTPAGTFPNTLSGSNFFADVRFNSPK